MINFALKYLSLGFSVIPLRVKGKEPLIPWAEFQKRRPSESEVMEWWKKWPNANVGIVTGAVSSIAVVDLDGPDGLASAERLGLKSGVVSLTGSGKHLWYMHPGGTNSIENSVRKYPGIDIRGDGGYVVAPPSIHENGRRYRWLTPFNLATLTTVPVIPSVNSVQSVAESFKPKEESWIAKALEGMKNGNIDDTLFTLCSRLRADGYSQDDARTLLQPHADRVGATPGHLDEKIRNVWARYEPRLKANVQSPLWPLYSADDNGGLVIHSPTDPDSLKRFNELRLESPTDTSSRLLTGYPKLDAMLSGGLKSSRLFTIAARTGVGKTNWLIAASKHLCQNGKKVLLFSTEMPYTQIWERLISSLGKSEDFSQYPFFVCDSFAPNLERVEEAINEIKPDVFMFDHINHVAEDPREIGSFMQGLNLIRRKYECAGIITAQLNRQADWVDLKTGEKITPRMSMIKGSGTIEQASSRVLLLSETRVTSEGTEIVGNLDKNDNGPKGLVHFMLKTAPYRMEEL